MLPVPQEPKDVIDSVLDEEIVFAPDFSARIMVMYIPWPIVEAVGKLRLYKQAQSIYHRSFTDWASRVKDWENSVSIRLPLMDQPDPKLQQFKESILELYGQVSGERRGKAPRRGSQRPWLEKSRPVRPEDLVFDFFELETRLEISDAVLGHVGRTEIEQIAARMFEKALPFWKGRKIEWLPGFNTYSLVLPPVPTAQREAAEKFLRRRIRDAYEGR